MGEVLRICEKCGCEIMVPEDVSDASAPADERCAICETCHTLLVGAIVAPATSAQDGRAEAILPDGAVPSGEAEPDSPTLLSRLLPASRFGRVALAAGALLVFLTLGLAGYLLFANGDDPAAEASNEEVPDETESADASTIVPPQLPDTAQSEDETAKPPAEPSADDRFRNSLASEDLAAIRHFRDEHPDDREQTFFRLWKMMQRYDGTLAADEARQWCETLGVPAEFQAATDWPQSWTASGDLPRVQFHEEWDHRYFVYETHPPSVREPIRLSRKLTVPADRPFLTCPVRGHDQGDCEVWMEVDGRPAPHVTAGSAWQSLTVDLNAFKGREVDVTIVHQATDWNNEYAYWQMPRFVAQAPAGAATATLLSSDVAPTSRAAVQEEETEAELLEVNWSKALNLLALVKPADDTVSGQWKLENGALRCGRTSPARLVFPYQPPDEYAVRAVFTVEEHAEAVTLLLSHGSKNFCCLMGGWNNTVCGFALVNGGNASGNPTTVRKGGVFTIGQPHTMVVHVRNRSLRASLDDKPVCQFQTDYRNVSPDTGWDPDPGRRLWLGLGTWDTRVAFHSVEVVELSGKGKMQRLPSGVLTSALPNTERGVMARWLGELGELMRSERFAEARQRIRELSADTSSSNARAALQRDAELLTVSEQLLKHSLQGFAQLTDGREFILWKANGTRLPIGGKDGHRILKVDENRIEVEMRIGGGKVMQRVGLDYFSPRSQADAALLVIPADPGYQPERAMAAILRFREGEDIPGTHTIRKELDNLARSPNSARVTERLRGWLEQAERERKARADFAVLKTTLTAHSPDDLERALKAYEDAHRETAAYAELLPELRKLKEDFGRKPGRKRVLGR
jgi:hypothetical protein